jgi:mannose-1-phosphate guanylyltransferase / mannose-6-phosphate isomerase
MEKSKKVAVVPCNFGWSDIGSWEALRELSPVTPTAIRSTAKTCCMTYTTATSIRPSVLVGGVGLRDLIIVDTPDALLIADAKRSQDVKYIAQTQAPRPSRLSPAPHRHPAVGHLHGVGGRPPLQNQTHRGQAAGHVVPANAPPPQRTLDRGQRHGKDHQWRR